MVNTSAWESRWQSFSSLDPIQPLELRMTRRHFMSAVLVQITQSVWGTQYHELQQSPSRGLSSPRVEPTNSREFNNPCWEDNTSYTSLRSFRIRIPLACLQ